MCRTRLTAAAAVLLAAATPAAAQQTPTPDLLQQAQSDCPADARIRYDVTSIPDADGVRWELRRGSPDAVPSWETAAPLDQGQTNRSTGNRPVRLREYGATLNGTPYLARVRATRNGEPLAQWSAPAQYAPSLAPTTAMFSATPLTTSTPPGLRLGWTLTGGLGACADRILYEIKKDAPFGSPTAVDINTTMAEVLPGATGERVLPITTGPGDYYIRILARSGGDGPGNDVGLRSPAIRVSFPAPVITYAVEVLILDGAAGACANSPVARGGATARLTGGGRTWTETADAQGRARFTAPAGAYTLQALHQGCTSAHASVTVAGDVQQTLTLSNCDALTRADLAVTLGGVLNPVGGQPYPLSAVVRNRGTARALAGQVVLRRLDAAGSAPVTLNTTALPELCPGQERAYGSQDPSPAAGQTYTYTLQTSVSDADNGNNLTTRTVSFAYQLVASQPVALDPAPVSIVSFAVRGGLPHVTVNRAVPLTATATGNPTEYRAIPRQVDCPTSLARARWQAWSASSPPLWTFNADGPWVICFQLRRGGDETAVLSSFGSDGIRAVVPTWTSPFMGNAGLAPGFPAPNPSPTRLSCGSQFAVGVDTRAGLLVDAVALRCADLGEAGEHSNAITTDFVGGPGGQPVNLRCQSGEVLTMVDIQYGVYVNRLSIYCRPWRRDSGAIGGRSPRGTAGGSGTGLVSKEAACTAALGVNAFPSVYLRGGAVPGTGPFLTAFDVHCAAPPGL